MGGYNSVKLMNLKEEFELHEDLVAGIATSIFKDPQNPYLEHFLRIPESTSHIYDLLDKFNPKEEDLIIQKKIINNLINLLEEIVRNVSVWKS